MRAKEDIGTATITQIPGALTTDQRKVSYGAKPFTDFSVTSGEFASTCKEKQ